MLSRAAKTKVESDTETQTGTETHTLLIEAMAPGQSPACPTEGEFSRFATAVEGSDFLFDFEVAEWLN